MGNDKSNEPRRKKAQEIRPLDMFLLVLVKGGLITPYDWQSRAHTSLGASLPAARRLLEAGLLKKVAKAPRDRHERDRHEHALTPKGADELHNLARYVEDALDEPPSDLESVIRLACLATVIGETDMAKKLLRDATETHRRRARAAKKRTTIVPFRSELGGLYSMLMTHCEIDQQAVVADQLESLRRRWDTVTKAIFELGSADRRARS
jgi:hypothetical protein